MILLFHLFLLILLFNKSDSRVFCEDSNAMPWKPLTFACPVTCGNVAAVVQRLRIADAKDVLHDDKHLRQGLETQEHIEVYEKDVVPHLTELLKAYALSLNHMRRNILQYEDTKMISVFTDLLNNYTHTGYKFSEELGAKILEKILTAETDNLRDKHVDLKKVVKFLGQAILKHKLHMKEIKHPIYVSSQNCLSIFVAGCVCKPGFVESSGQCVTARHCFDSDTAIINEHYLARVRTTS